MLLKEIIEDPLIKYLRKTAHAESAGKSNAKNPNSSAQGLFQFTASTFKGISDRYGLGYSLEDRNDPKKAEVAMRLFTQENEKKLKPVVGRELNDGDRYLGHFLGVGGATNLFKKLQNNPNAPISSVMSPEAIKANKSVVYNKDGSLKTVGNLYDWAQKKMSSSSTPIYDTHVSPYITPAITNLTVPAKTDNFVEEEQEVKEPKEVAEAKTELTQKQQEYNFLTDYVKKEYAQPLAVQQQQQPEQEEILPDVTEEFAQIEQFIDTPIMQKGGKFAPKDERHLTVKTSESTAVPQPKHKNVLETQRAVEDKEEIDTKAGQNLSAKDYKTTPRSALYSKKEREDFKNKGTKEFFEKAKEYLGPEQYERLLDIHYRSEKPTVDIGMSKAEDFLFQGRNHYNPVSNNITITKSVFPKNEYVDADYASFEEHLQAYVAEASHAIQDYTRPETAGQFFLKDIPGYVKAALSPNDYKQEVYEKKGTNENHTHSTIQPELEQYLWGSKPLNKIYQEGGTTEKEDFGLFSIRPSEIQGKGVFINKDIPAKEIIGLAHRDAQPASLLGQYHNHSDNPNSESVKINNERYLFSLRPLKKGEEITVNYRKQPELEQPESFEKNQKMQHGGKFAVQNERMEAMSQKDNTPDFRTKFSLLLKETKNAEKDKQELRSSGTIKNPRSLHYQKLAPKLADVKQQTKSDAELEGQLGLERPLVYMASPDKLLGDMGVPGMETSELDRQAVMANRFNPNQTRAERFINNAKIGAGYVPEATVNGAMAAAFMPEGSGALGLMSEAVNPLAGMGMSTSIPKHVRNGLSLNGFSSPQPSSFKSEIDWGKWNNEIPNNAQLMQEYEAIEQTAKADGTWMKTADGSTFSGTPEQFVQQSSENFRKAFPEGFNETFRGTTGESANLKPNRTIFTGSESLAKGYARITDRDGFLRSAETSNSGGVHHLAYPKSSNSLTHDTRRSDWQNVNLDSVEEATRSLGKNIEWMTQNIARRKEIAAEAKQLPDGSWEIPSSDGGIPANLFNEAIEAQEQELKNLINIKNKGFTSTNPEMLASIKKELGNRPMTDDIAEYMEKAKIDSVTLQNIQDGSFGDITMVNHKPGNYLKSLRGNNGMFDMSDPNIYKAVVPVTAAGTYFATQGQEQPEPKLQQGGTVSEIYERTTGKSWSTARQEGLTDGSAKRNLELIESLKRVTTPGLTPQAAAAQGEPRDFNEAFKQARQTLGANKVFQFQGKTYGTNIAGEKFEPSDEDLQKVGLPVTQTRQRLKEQNQQVESLYTTKKTVKLEPQYKDWEAVKARKNEINSHSNAERIIKYQSSNPTEQYIVVDKKQGRMHLYQGGKEIKSYKVGTGVNEGDEQTATWVDKTTKKVDWSKGNYSTGAGTYTISGSTSKNKEYSNVPSFNMKNEYGIEVPMAIHAALPSRVKAIADNDPTNNRVSSGCINGLCHDLKDLYSHNIKPGTKVYVLPDDEKNEYVYENGKLNFKSKNSNVNRTVNTLNYKPVKIAIDDKKFREEVFQWNDFNDEEEYENTTKPFVAALQDNKKAIMKAAKINGDVYNDIAKVAFGIYGTEVNFGDTHSAVGNVVRATKKVINPSSSSSPDYKAKAGTYSADENSNSVGLTQIRFSYLNADEKKALKEVGITSNQDFLDPRKAAIGTAVVLGIRYNQQLTPREKQDIMTNLPKKWNNRANYPDRVKKNSKYLSIKELN